MNWSTKRAYRFNCAVVREEVEMDGKELVG
jgi:hypothetical protein